MPNTYGDPAWVDAVSERIEAKVCAATGLPRDCVFLTLEQWAALAKNAPAEQFVAFKPDRMPVDAKIVAGAGAAHTMLESVWSLAVFARVNADQQNRNTRAMRDSARGLAALVAKVCGTAGKPGLQLNPLLPDGSTASPLKEPMRLLDIEWPAREPSSGHAFAVTRWQVKFRADFSGA